MATISKVIVLSLRPSLRVLFSHPLLGGPDTLPVLSWQFVVIQQQGNTGSKRTKVTEPVLAFGRQATVYFYQVGSCPSVINKLKENEDFFLFFSVNR